MPIPKFYAIDARLRRANYHLGTIKRMAREHLQSDAHTLSGNYDGQTDTLEIDRFVEIPDPRFPTIVGEYVHNLRSALDHLAWQMVEAVNPGAAGEQTAFPVLKIGPTPKTKGPNKGATTPPHISGGVSPAAAKIVAANQPYIVTPNDTQEDPLWLLQRMWIIDKHRHVPIHGQRMENLVFSGNLVLMLASSRPSFAWDTEIDSVTDYGADLRVFPLDPKMQVEGSVSIHIVLEEPPGHTPPLMETLVDARERVRKIVKEARKLPELQ